MIIAREHIVSLLIGVVAILVIVGGYASFSGLATATQTLNIQTPTTFKNSDVFDAYVSINPVTLLAEESLVIYIDNEAVGVVALRQYMDANNIDYGTEVKNLGSNNEQIMTLKAPLLINLADYVTLENMHPGTTHLLRVELSQGDAIAEEVFRIS